MKIPKGDNFLAAGCSRTYRFGINNDTRRLAIAFRAIYFDER